MSDTITLDEIKTFAAGLSPWAHLASVGADGKPDVVPVHPCWDGDTCWVMIGSDSVKARNIAHRPDVAMHWQVTAVGDGVELWGTAEVFTDLDTKRRLWSGVFDYDLNAFAPGGPDDSPGTGFLAITPERALVLHQYGMGGMQRWSANA
jgi:general stress protein 26